MGSKLVTDKRYLDKYKNTYRFNVKRAHDALRPYLHEGLSMQAACELAGVNYRTWVNSLAKDPELKAEVMREMTYFKREVVKESRQALLRTVKRTKKFTEAHKFALEKYDPELQKKSTNVQVNILNKIQDDAKEFGFEEQKLS